ncbi:MAG TPA: LytTR family DNA-binding domain-containing protein [Bacteroidales bacterium]|nr:response regulator transcription factor [Bacteroidales bacterium]HPE56964.1 LytTR family DNA-binding domain-containing protein [Bacteroidales bacterium]
MLTAVIVEDEKRSRETLSGLLKLYCKSVQVVAEADNVRSGIEAIKVHKPQLLFLDIQMPDGSGFNLLESLDKIDFDIIFTTAYDQFAIKAIKFSALDYLLKPIFPEDLVAAVNKAEAKKESSGTSEGIKVLLENMRRPESDSPKIVLSTSDKINVVKVKDILRCESDNYYTMYYFTDGKRLLVSKTLKENEELLSGYNFIRPHKSHLVNTIYIKSFNKQDGGYIVMTDGTSIPVSRRKKEKIIEIINNL